MEINETVMKFKAHLAKMAAYSHASSILYYDVETVMPDLGKNEYGKTIAFLSEQRYKLSTSEDLKTYVEEILAHKDEVDFVTIREAEELQENFEKMSKIPMEDYVAYTTAVNNSQIAWHEAKEKSDYSIFEPHLAELLDYTVKFAKMTNPKLSTYNAQLDNYEKGLNTELLDAFFADIRQTIKPLMQKIADHGKCIDDSFLKLEYPIDKQRELSQYLMDVLGLDKQRSTIGETEHPFTIGISADDVRITTHYYKDYVASNIYSVVHEGGHALYELNIGRELENSPLRSGTSMSIHESQSRFYENIIGRSEEFISYIYPKLLELFPTQLNGVSAHDFYLAVNKSEPSLIRTEADELTYSLHIMVRYELEKRLLSGELSTKDLPAEWNRLYKEYIGIDVPNDKVGVLQDSHWSSGSFGYFPSYALGSAYGVQMLESMKKNFNPFEQISKGNIMKINEWLTDKVFKYGCLLKPNEIIKTSCNAEFDSKYYTDYLTKKFTEIYEL